MGESTSKVAPWDKYPSLRAKIEALEKMKEQHYSVIQRVAAAHPDLFKVDFVMVAIFKRSLDLLDAALVLLERWNFNASAPLLRLQLDNVLRLVCLMRVSNSEDVASAILDGQRLHMVRDHEGKPLTDERLREYARPDFLWVDDLYRDTSALVHLSAKHWFITIAKTDDAERIAHFEVSVGSRRWPENELQKCLDFWIETTRAVLVVATGWALTKERMRKPDGGQ